jgi:cyanophycin synthetase
MNLHGVSALHGPNLWAKVSVLEALVDCRAWQQATSNDLLGWEKRLSVWLPGLTARNGSSTLERQPHPPGLAAAKMLLKVVLELQAVCRTPVNRGRAMTTDEPDVYRVIIPYIEETLARACLKVACRNCLAALDRADFDALTELARLADLADRVCLGGATGPIVAMAQSRGIPFRRLDEESLVQLGHGARQRKIWKSLTDCTGKVAEWISLDKERTKRLLRQLGVPVPWGRTATTQEEAWGVACEIGLPVAIKPCDTDCGVGVSLHLTTREHVETAFTAAKQFRDVVIVERFVAGEQYRLTVVGERVVAAVRRDSPRLVGDGQNSVAELIELANRDPRRGEAEHLPLAYISPETDTPHVLAEQGLDFDSVPAVGADVCLSRLAHAWAGGSVTDVTDEIHPQVAAQCVFAVRTIGLDIAGVDVITTDIRHPFEEQGGVIVEVNAQPALWLHSPPFCNVGRPVCEAIVDSLFPAGGTGRIPLVAVTGNGDNLAIGRLLCQLLRGSNRRIGWASSDGLYLNGLRLTPGRQDGLAGTHAVLLNPQVDAAVLERSLECICEEGLGVDHLDVAIVSRIGGDTSNSAFVRAARVLIETVGREGAVVLDADEPLLVTLAESVSASLIVVTADGDHPQIGSDCGRKQRAVYLREGHVVLREFDGSEQIVGTTAQDWLEAAGCASPTVLLAAVAAAWGSRFPIEALRTKLSPLAQEQAFLRVDATITADSVLV